MQVSFAEWTFQCDSALRGNDYIILYVGGEPVATFTEITNFDDFQISGGDWSYPYVTLDKDNWTGTKATGTVTITGTANTVIPAGTVITLDTEDESPPTFQTREQAQIASSGSVDVEIICTTDTDAGNVWAGAEFTCTIDAVTAITNEDPIEGGGNAPFTQQADFAGVTATNDVIVTPRAEGKTDAENEELSNALIEATYQGAGYLIFTARGDRPTIDLKFNVRPLL